MSLGLERKNAKVAVFAVVPTMKQLLDRATNVVFQTASKPMCIALWGGGMNG